LLNVLTMLQLNFSTFPVLQTASLVLRQLAPEDVTAITALRNNEIVNQYLGRPKKTTTEEALLFIDKINKSIANNQSVYWAIALQENNFLIGTICYYNIDAEKAEAEIGYELHPDHHGKGIMQEAMAAVIDYGFNTMQLKVITAFTMQANIASVKSLERNNFKLDTTGKYSGEADETPGGAVYVLEK
jgi:[ribosomal protein S5]-alanine N-acetyltransferase